MGIDIDRLMDLLDRVHTGPVLLEDEFNLKVIPGVIAEVLKKYGLENTVDLENPINTDDDLADRFYQAGFEAAIKIGMVCKDTNRVIRFNEQELQSGIDQAPSEFWLGEGNQRVQYTHRYPEDTTPPVFTAPFSIAVTEDVIVPMVEGFARIPQIDALEGPSLEKIRGKLLFAGSPYELLAGKYQAELMHEGIRRAGREGMPIDCSASSFTHYGVLGGYGVPGGYRTKHDLVVNLPPADFWLTYESLFKLAHMYVHEGEYSLAASWIMLGGYCGGPEGTAVACIANTLLCHAALQPSRAGSPPYDIGYMGSVNRRAQWALSVFLQAVARNTKTVLHGAVNQVSGPCTRELLYEALVSMMNCSVSGASNVTGMRSAGGRRTNHVTPLENQFGGEVYKGVAGMSREQACEIARRFIPKYEKTLKQPSDGKPFEECYDIESLKPTPEWQRMYDEIREEAVQAGVPMG